MSYKVNFFTFTKKSNSTKVPSVTGAEFDCIVKSETGILNPTVTLVQTPTFSPTYNYCHIAVFGRWYWVREWTFSDRAWTASLEVDVLGSYKSAIGAESFYILRASNESDGNIVDTHYPLKANATQSVTSPTNTTPWWTFSGDIANGNYVVGVRGFVKSGQASGTTTFLVLTPSEFKSFTQKIFDSQMTDFVSGQTLDITETLAKMIFDPTKFIASCVWIPGTAAGTSQTSGINVGWWSFAGTYKVCSPGTYISFGVKAYQLPDHSQAAARGTYLNTPPFTYRLVHLPRVGLVDISDKIPANAGALFVELAVDPISGEGLYKLYWGVTPIDQTYYQFDEIQVQIGVEIPLTSTLLTMQDFASGLSSVGNTALNLLTGNILGAAGDFASAFSSFTPHPTDIGKHSGFLGLTNDPGYPYVLNKFCSVVDANPTEDGKPLCKIRQVSNLAGYMKVLHGDIAISGATAVELDQIREQLEEGFYYE
jgi:hypothetical protein